MKAVRKLISRNMKLYFRDYAAVFFSLLAVLIVLALYILFLADMQVDSVNSVTGGALARKDISYLVNSWILAGLLSITTVTSTLGGYGTMVSDREKKTDMDFRSSALARGVYPLANVISSFLIGAAVSAAAFAVYAVFIAASTGYRFSAPQILGCLLVICLSALMNAALLGFIVSLLRTSGGFSSVSSVFGAVIGFLNGVYVPLGSLPSGVQDFVRVLPFMHIASVFRRILTSESAAICFENAGETALDTYQKDFGIVLYAGSGEISIRTSVIYIAVFTAAALICFFINYGRKQRTL